MYVCIWNYLLFDAFDPNMLHLFKTIKHMKVEYHQFVFDLLDF